MMVSIVALLVIGWFLFYGKIKAVDFLSTFLNKVPKNKSELIKTTENILGTAAERVKTGGTLKRVTEKGSEFFEQSDYTQPARDIRENVKEKIDQVIDSAKQLPEKELHLIKEQVCREWLGNEQVATQSGAK